MQGVLVPSSPKSSTRSGIGITLGIVAGVLAASAVITIFQSRRAEARHPPAGHFIDVDGVRLHYIDKGLGVPVLLIHGAGVSADDYVASGVVEQLSEHHRVVAFDRPGYGYSERPAGPCTARTQAGLLHAACDRLGIDRAVIVGHSWGTLVALEMALMQPDRVVGLVLASGYYYPTARVDSLILAIPAIPVLGQIMRHTVSPLLGRPVTLQMERRMFSPHPVPGAFHAGMPLAFRMRPGQLRASAQDAGRMISSADNLNSRYSDIRVPVTILAGSEDGIVNPADQSQRLSLDLQRADVELIAGAGHMVHYSHPECIARAVKRILSAAGIGQPSRATT
jgi:pimeloyl-ACP methyl ester carboxylesterase